MAFHRRFLNLGEPGKPRRGLEELGFARFLDRCVSDFILIAQVIRLHDKQVRTGCRILSRLRIISFSGINH